MIVLGYVFIAVVCLGFFLLRVPVRELDPDDPADTIAPRGGLAARRGSPEAA